MSRSLCLSKMLIILTLLDVMFLTTCTSVPPRIGESKVPDSTGILSMESSSKENDVGKAPVAVESTTQDRLKKRDSRITTIAEPMNEDSDINIKHPVMARFAGDGRRDEAAAAPAAGAETTTKKSLGARVVPFAGTSLFLVLAVMVALA